MAWHARLGYALYRYHYHLGIWAVRRMRRQWRRTAFALAPLTHAVSSLWQRFVAEPAVGLYVRFARMFASFPVAFRELREVASRNLKDVFPHFIGLCRRAINRYRDELHTIWHFIGPVTASVLLLVTISSWSKVDFALALEYQGQDLGLIESEAVYEAAANLARQRVNNEDNSFSVDSVPQLAITMKRGNGVLNDTELCDAILRTAGDSIAEATGLYIDGNFVGSVASHPDLAKLLEDIKDGYYDKNDPDQRAEFIQDVRIVDGLYPISTVIEPAELQSKLVSESVVKKTYTVQAGDVLGTIAKKHDMTISELRAMNPSFKDTDMVRIGDVLTVQRPQTFLQVKVIKTIRYTEKIDYITQTVYNDKQPVTYSKVKVKGQEGSQDVVAEITYLDGLESSRQVISTNVTKQPVTKVVEKGTKKVVSSGGNTVVQGDGVATGNMAWPVPVCHRVYQGYHRGHYAIDISSGPIPVNNKPAVAADGGKVVYAGWYYGYGKYVKIDHGNGLYTTYAHLNSISVVVGQQVTRGQQVGLIGSTGNSTGPHLHFEVIKNGVRVNPLNYVKP